MKNRSITEEIKKIIAILQNIDGKKIWNLSCVLSGMSIINAHVEDQSRTVLKMEKKSLLDFVQKMSPEQYKAKINAAKGGEDTGKEDETNSQVNSESNTEEKMKKLADLEKAIQAEKAALLKEGKKAKTVKVEKVKKKE